MPKYAASAQTKDEYETIADTPEWKALVEHKSDIEKTWETWVAVHI